MNYPAGYSDILTTALARSVVMRNVVKASMSTDSEPALWALSDDPTDLLVVMRRPKIHRLDGTPVKRSEGMPVFWEFFPKCICMVFRDVIGRSQAAQLFPALQDRSVG